MSVLGRIYVALIGVAALLGASSAAFAVEAVATGAVNVRTGPGTSYPVVDTLHAGEVVDVTECNASNTWCRIFHSGPDGWVSRSYLGAPSPSDTGGPAVEFGFSFPLPGGGSITFGTPGYTPPYGGGGGGGGVARVCVYDLPNYAGANVCLNAGASDNSIGAAWNNKVTSLRVFGGASIRLCQNVNYGGFCNVFSTNQTALGTALNNKASSYDIMPPEPSRVCFYDLPDYAGPSTCVSAGSSAASLPPALNDKITSLRVFGGATVRLCQSFGFSGFCNTFSTNVPTLGALLNNKASSYQTW